MSTTNAMATLTRWVLGHKKLVVGLWLVLTIGGFAATRSSGQSSAGYGRFDALVVALTVVTPTGVVTLGTAPASAAAMTGVA